MQCLFVQGPTASGKTEVALSLAKQLSCEIISCDSIQVYKHTDIGSAKPTLKERQEVPHHLVDFVEPPKEYTAGEYRRDALQVLADLNDKKQKHCIIVGGTGFYFKALEFGMHEFPPTPKEIVKAVEEELASKGKEALYEELKNRDPEYAQKIAPQDSYRLQKAIEILRSSNSTPSQIRAQFVPQDFPYPIKKVVLQPNREELRDRVRRRFKKCGKMILKKRSNYFKVKIYLIGPPCNLWGIKKYKIL